MARIFTKVRAILTDDPEARFMKRFFIAVLAIMLIYTSAAGAKTPESADQPRYEEVVVCGSVVRSDQTGKKKIPSYEFISEKKERYRLIGPKTMLDLFPTYPDFEKMKFKIAGNMYKSKSNSKKGIMIKSLEPYYENAPKVPEAFQKPEQPAAASENKSASTAEVKIIPATGGTTENGVGGKTK